MKVHGVWILVYFWYVQAVKPHLQRMCMNMKEWRKQPNTMYGEIYRGLDRRIDMKRVAGVQSVFS